MEGGGDIKTNQQQQLAEMAYNMISDVGGYFAIFFSFFFNTVSIRLRNGMNVTDKSKHNYYLFSSLLLHSLSALGRRGLLEFTTMNVV